MKKVYLNKNKILCTTTEKGKTEMLVCPVRPSPKTRPFCLGICAWFNTYILNGIKQVDCQGRIIGKLVEAPEKETKPTNGAAGTSDHLKSEPAAPPS